MGKKKIYKTELALYAKEDDREVDTMRRYNIFSKGKDKRHLGYLFLRREARVWPHKLTLEDVGVETVYVQW